MFGKIKDKASELFYLTPQMHLDCNREMLIENCRRIEEYNDVYISVVSCGMSIHVWGSGLRAEDFRTGGLIIRGRITQIEFIERSARNEGPDKGQSEDKRSGT